MSMISQSYFARKCLSFNVDVLDVKFIINCLFYFLVNEYYSLLDTQFLIVLVRFLNMELSLMVTLDRVGGAIYSSQRPLFTAQLKYRSIIYGTPEHIWRPPTYGWIAQLVERRHFKPEVVGSSPAPVNVSLFKPKICKCKNVKLFKPPFSKECLGSLQTNDF